MSFLSTKSIASLSFDLTVGPTETHTTLQSAIAAANDGQNILVKAGTYAVSSTITVNKKVKIVGENVDTVIFETAGTTSDPVQMFNVTSDDVALAKLTIKHKKTSNTSVETAIVASGGGFPQSRIRNFILEQCKIEYVEIGLAVRVEGWTVKDCTFTYATGAVGNSNRCIIMYGTKGNAYIKNTHFKNDVLNGTSFRPIYLTSTTGSNSQESVSGKLVIDGSTHSGPLTQFFNQDNQQSTGAGTFELQFKNNIINESNLFVGFFSSTANAGDMFSSIWFYNNTLSNLHAVDGGKGIFGVYGSASFRTTPLVFHGNNNILGQLTFRSGWESVFGSAVGKELAVPYFDVSGDAQIPASETLGSIFDASEVLSLVTSPASYTITSGMKSGTETFDLVLTKSALKDVIAGLPGGGGGAPQTVYEGLVKPSFGIVNFPTTNPNLLAGDVVTFTFNSVVYTYTITSYQGAAETNGVMYFMYLADSDSPIANGMEFNSVVTRGAGGSIFNDESNWRIVGAIFKEPTSAKRVIAAFRDFDSPKAAKIRSEVQAGDVVKFHKLILSNDQRELLVLKPEDLA